MNTIHHTKALVLSSRSYREADRLFVLLTEDFGLIYAVATGIRLEKSKLRYSLTNLAFVEIAMVQGKNGMWRITGADRFGHAYYECEHEQQYALFIRATSLIQQLVHGEDADSDLFGLMYETFTYIKKENISDDALNNIECILMLRILHSLGYIGNTKQFENILFENSWSQVQLVADMNKRKDMIKEINRAIRESQL